MAATLIYENFYKCVAVAVDMVSCSLTTNASISETTADGAKVYQGGVWKNININVRTF
jgi:hypothetical protein